MGTLIANSQSFRKPTPLQGAESTTSFLKTPGPALFRTNPAKRGPMSDSDRLWLPMVPLQAALERSPVNTSNCQHLHEASTSQKEQMSISR
jgi:hypothetical protein